MLQLGRSVYRGRERGSPTLALGSDLVTNGGFSNSSVSGSQLIPNGDMEANSDWADSGTSVTNEQSAEQAHGGTKSWKVVADGQGDGIKQTSARSNWGS